MIAIKLFFRGETRRAQIYTERNDITFEILVSTAQNLFPALRGNLKFYWTDEENDTIVVTSDDELLEAARVMAHENRKVMRFEIRENQDEELLTSYLVPEATVAREINMAIHNNIRCDGCDVSPIVGTRYKCAVREDYDLCELCEGKETQPHPMIKINNPDQAPAAIMIALRDEQGPRGPWRGPHHRGHHHHGHHHHPHDGPHPPCPPHGPHNRNPYDHRDGPCGPGGPFHCMPGGPFPCGPGPWRRMMRHNERKAAEAAAQAQNSQNQGQNRGRDWGTGHNQTQGNWGISALTKSRWDLPMRDQPFERPDGSDAIDDDFLEEAVRQSLEGCSMDSAAATAAASAAASASTASIASDPVSATYSPAVGGSVAAGSVPEGAIAIAIPALATPVPLSKPMARFVRDITFPDGTNVQPGSVFLKTWRIRNDGAHAWPDNVVLTCSGGDALSATDVVLPVDSLQAGCEADVTLQLCAPEGTGRHVAYFRMQTSDKVYFGQRLWADIRVVDDDQGWHLLGGMLATSVPSPSENWTESEGKQVKDLEAVGADVTIPSAQATASATASATATTPPADSVPSADPVSSIPIAGPFGAFDGLEDMGSSQSSVDAVWTRVWAKELQMLTEMGFTDTPAAVRLLQRHLGIPASLSSADSHVSPEGMQNVISSLLSDEEA